MDAGCPNAPRAKSAAERNPLWLIGTALWRNRGNAVQSAGSLKRGCGMAEEETFALVRDLVRARPLPPIEMKGISREVVPYSVEGLLSGFAQHSHVFYEHGTGMDISSTWMRSTMTRRSVPASSCRMRCALSAEGRAESRRKEAEAQAIAERHIKAHGGERSAE
jgi:hypothetical protein